MNDVFRQKRIYLHTLCREYLTGFSKRKRLRKAKAKLDKAKLEQEQRKKLKVEVCRVFCVPLRLVALNVF